MIKLKQILLEGQRTKELYLEEAKLVYNDNCSNHNPSTTPLYRGLRDYEFDYGLVRPAGYTRKSRNTKNYYTLITDNSPKWRRFPNRSQSIICTTSFQYASGYGSVYRVIPFDGASIGIAPANDMWNSIKKIKDDYGMWLGKFNRLLHDITKLFSNYKWELDEKNFAKFKKQLVSMGKDKEKFFKEVEFSANYGSMFGKEAIKFAQDYKDFSGNLYEFIESLFDPDQNGFEVKKYTSSFKAPTYNEVWTDSDCLLINEFQYDQFIKQV